MIASGEVDLLSRGLSIRCQRRKTEASEMNGGFDQTSATTQTQHPRKHELPLKYTNVVNPIINHAQNPKSPSPYVEFKQTSMINSIGLPT
jgi:hypothetical protein